MPNTAMFSLRIYMQAKDKLGKYCLIASSVVQSLDSMSLLKYE